MNVGSIVTVLYEPRALYIILSIEPRSSRGWSEREYKLLSLEDGSTRIARYSVVKMISRSSNHNETDFSA